MRNKELYKELNVYKNELEKYKEKKLKIDMGVGTNPELEMMSEQTGSQMLLSDLLKSEYVKLYKDIQIQNKDIENKNKNANELTKLAEMITKCKIRGHGGISRKKSIKSCQSMTSMDLNSIVGFSNSKTRTKAAFRLGLTCKKEKSKGRGHSISCVNLRTERNLKNITNKIKKSSKTEQFSSSKDAKGQTKRSKSHIHTSENPCLGLIQSQLESQKKSTQNLLRLTSRVFNAKAKDCVL